MNEGILLKNLMKTYGYSVKDMADKIRIPYSTLRKAISENNILSLPLFETMEMFYLLGTTLDSFRDITRMNELSNEESLLLQTYRSSEFQSAVNRLLGIDS